MVADAAWRTRVIRGKGRKTRLVGEEEEVALDFEIVELFADEALDSEHGVLGGGAPLTELGDGHSPQSMRGWVDRGSWGWKKAAGCVSAGSQQRPSLEAGPFWLNWINWLNWLPPTKFLMAVGREGLGVRNKGFRLPLGWQRGWTPRGGAVGYQAGPRSGLAGCWLRAPSPTKRSDKNRRWMVLLSPGGQNKYLPAEIR